MVLMDEAVDRATYIWYNDSDDNASACVRSIIRHLFILFFARYWRDVSLVI